MNRTKRSMHSWFPAALAFAVLACGLGSPARGVAATLAQVTGEIELITIDNPADHWSGGTIVVGGQVVTLPANLLIDLPANRLTLKQIYDQAPAACVAGGETGLAKSDVCNASGAGGFATISANRTSGGNVIAGDVLIEKGREAVTGDVTFINYDQGYFRLNGTPGSDTTGVKVRLNDPTARHTVQTGPECLPGSLNCSPDPRFTLDPDNYTNVFSTGYPICIPSTAVRPFIEPANYDVNGNGTPGEALTSQADAAGSGDLLCPDTNRPPTLPINPITAADSRRFAPIMLGDNMIAEGNFETVNGVRFLSTHTIMVSRAMVTKADADQPDYFFIAEFELDAPGFQNQRARMLNIGFATSNPDILFWTLHRDPLTNAVHEFPLASVRGCDLAAGAATCGNQGLVGAGANIYRIRYDVDFLVGAKDKLNPCMHLRREPRFNFTSPVCPNSGPGGANDELNVTDQWAILSPIPHEIQARTGKKLADAGGLLVTLDVKGDEATNGQYLFPLGINLGGVSIPEMNEIDLNALGTPFLFSGIPWNLDRRLSPGGCIDTTVPADGIPDCEGAPQPLTPFPFEGLDPRMQASLLPTGSYADLNFTASALGTVRNRILSFVDGALGTFNGDSTRLTWPPADPAGFPVSATPLTLPSCGGGGVIAPVTAVDDAVSTYMNIVTTIDVLANDLGSVDPASIGIVSELNGTALQNANGTVTFTPTGDFTGLAGFVYTVNDRLGNPSNNATVGIQVNPGIVGAGALPIAASDSAATLDTTPVNIPVLANDTFNGVAIDPLTATVNIMAQPAPGTGSVTVNPDKTVTFTPVIGFQGGANFTYSVTTGGPMTSNLATAAVAVTRVNTPPLLAAIAPQATVFGAAFTLHATATDSPGDVLLFSLTGAPAGMTINATTGLIGWTPTVAQVGANPVTVQVADQGGLFVATSFTVTVGNTAPQVAPIAAQTAGVDTPFTLLVAATDTPNDTLAFALDTAPAGMTIDPASGLISWTPVVAQVGAHPVTVRATDMGGLVGTASFTVTVGQDNVSVLLAQFRSGIRRWRIEGVSSAPGATVTIYNSGNLGGVPLGTATADAFGVWRFRINRNGRLPNATRRISISSNAGGRALSVPVTVLR